MRLIDADKLKICYTGKNSLGTNENDSKADYASIRKMIDNQTTAYDVDKVLKKLNECINHTHQLFIDGEISTEEAIEREKCYIESICCVKGGLEE